MCLSPLKPATSFLYIEQNLKVLQCFFNLHEIVLLTVLRIQPFHVSFVLMFYQMHFDHASGAYFDFGNHTEKVCCLHLAI